MSTLTYVKGLPTPLEEMTLLGFTEFELFLEEFALLYKNAVCETVEKLLSTSSFNKSQFNSHLQTKYGINKRHANGIVSHAKGKLDSASSCRNLHIKQLEGKLKSAENWLANQQKKLKLAQRFYSKNLINSKTGCNFPISCDLKTRKSNWHLVKFNIHHKKRYIYKLSQKIKHIRNKPIQVKVSNSDILIVGSIDESVGNSTCQWDGDILRFRVPYCLQDRFGKYVETRIGNFDRNINRLPSDGAKTWHFYKKDNRWVAAIQFTPAKVERACFPLEYGAIGIDLNPTSIGWAYVDYQGNLSASGTIPLQPDLPNGRQQGQLVDVCLQIAVLTSTFSCPVVCEELDFSAKKEQPTYKDAVDGIRLENPMSYNEIDAMLKAAA